MSGFSLHELLMAEEAREQQEKDKNKKKGQPAPETPAPQAGPFQYDPEQATTQLAGTLQGVDQRVLNAQSIESISAANGYRSSFLDMQSAPEEEAITNARVAGFYEDSKGNLHPFSTDNYERPMGATTGTGGIVFSRPLPYEGTPYAGDAYDGDKRLAHEVKEGWGEFLSTHVGADYFGKWQEDKPYAFLYPHFDAKTNRYILKEFIGTKKEFRESGLDAYQHFGLPESGRTWFGTRDFMQNLYTSTVGQADDLLLGAAATVQGYARLATGNLEKKQAQESWLDKMHRLSLEDTQHSSFIPTRESEEFGWNMIGGMTGSVVGSLATYRALGGMALKGINLGNGVLASTLGKEVLKQTTAHNIARYGTSGVMGFGTAYNEAKKSGLNDQEALAFGTAVGFVTSAIETTGLMGKTDMLDKMLLGRGAKQLAKDLLPHVRGEWTEEAYKKGLSQVLPNILKGMKTQAGRSQFGRPMAEEAAEEAAQELAMQLGQLGFDEFLAEDGAKKGKGKFGAEFSMTEILTNAMAGAIGGGIGVFMTPGQRNVVGKYVREGRADHLKAGIDLLLKDNQITTLEHKNFTAYIETMNEVYGEHKGAFEHLDGDSEAQDELWQTVASMRESQLQGQRLHTKMGDRMKEMGHDNHAAMTKASDAEKKEIADLQETVDKKQQQADDFKAAIEKFKDPDYVAELKAKKEQSREKLRQVQSNAWEAYVQPAEGPETSVKKIIARESGPNAVAVRHAQEANTLLGALQDPNAFEDEGQRGDAIITLQRDLRKTGLFRSRQVNTMANRQALIDLGFNEDELPLTAEELVLLQSQRQAGSPDAALEARTHTDAEIQAAMEAAAQKAGAPAGSMEATAELYGNLKTYGLDASKLASKAAEHRQTLEQIFGKDSDQLKALDLMEQRAGRQVLPQIQNTAPGAAPTGLYSQASGVMVLRFDTALAQQGGKKGAAYRERVFALAVHESTHAMFDQYLFKTHKAYLHALKTGKMTVEAMQFKRYLDLARLAHAALKDKKRTKPSYFLDDVAPRTLPNVGNPSEQNTALELVKEFFAEALSDASFQKQLHAVNIDSKELAKLRASTYAYDRVGEQPRTLLTEVYGALKSFFSTLGSALTRKQRTLLTESYDMASTIQASFYHTREPLTETESQSIEQTSFMSHYAPMIVGADLNSDAFDITEQTLAQMAKLTNRNGDPVVKAQGIAMNQGYAEAFRKSMNAFIRETVLLDYEPGTAHVTYFRNTNDLLLSWVDGNNKTHRQFFNVYGQPTEISTNVFNQGIGNTLRKPDALSAFDGTYNHDSENQINRVILNNFARAQGEGFAGKTELVLSNRVRYINGEPFRGEVEMHYTTKAGERLHIGWMPDLTKVRLAGMLSRGARIELEAAAQGKGSNAFVQHAEDGTIKAMTRWAPGLATPEGFTHVQGFMPNVEFLFSKVTGITPEEAAAIQDGDQFTVQDGSPLDTSTKAFNDYRDLLVARAVTPESEQEAREVMERISFYDPTAITDPKLRQTLDFATGLIRRQVRRALAFMPTDGLAKETAVAKLNSRFNAFEQRVVELFPDDPQARQMGMDDAQFLKWSTELIEETAKEVGQFSRRKSDVNWEGHGSNPHNTVSAKIKYDLEGIAYEFEGEKRLLDFTDADDVLYDASIGTDSFAEFLESIAAYSNNDLNAARNRAIARAIHAHLTNPLSSEREMLQGAYASYWSQFASYIRRDAIVLQPDGDGVRRYFANQNQDLKGAMEQDAKRLRAIAEATKKAWEEAGKPGSLAAFFDQRAGMVQTASGEKLLANMVSSGIRAGMDAQKLGSDGMSDSKLTDAQYAERVQHVLDYLGFLGFELPASLLARDRVTPENHQEMVEKALAYLESDLQYKYANLVADYRSQGHSPEEVETYRRHLGPAYRAELESERRRLEAAPKNRYQYRMARFVRSKGSSDTNKRLDNHTMLELFAQVADRARLDVKALLEGRRADTANQQDLKRLREALQQMTGDHKTPMFFLDTKGNKRWSMKIKSFADDILQRLKGNHKGILQDYKASRMYRHNRIIRMLDENPGVLEHVAISGIQSEDSYRQNADYSSASEVDFHYMHLAGFVGGDAAKYFHVDDVPSDKPSVMAIQLTRIEEGAYAAEVENILLMERQRMLIAQEQFDEAFEELPDGTFVVVDDEKFNSLVHKVHYTEVGNTKTYKKGPIFDRANYFFNGAGTGEILSAIAREADAFYEYYTGRGLRVPVGRKWLEENASLRESDPSVYADRLEDERQRVYRAYVFNYTLNRYHLSQLQMGDYIFYKSGDEFGDLNKRKAGPSAPFQRGAWERERGTLAVMKDEEASLRLHNIRQRADGSYFVEEGNGATIDTNRGDAQGYMTEGFLSEIKRAYGDFSEYDAPLKPVMFGVNREHLDEARPMYLKLSLTLVPNPDSPAGQQFYADYPSYLPFAKRFYEAKTDMAIFESGVKVGAPHKTAMDSDEFNVREFDLRLFGLQNNPYHHADDEATISAGVQLEKQLGDNGNFLTAGGIRGMVEYHALVANILQGKAEELFGEKLVNRQAVHDFFIEQLQSREHTADFAQSVREGLRLDNPAVATLFENMVNALVNKVVSSPRKEGEKLVNASDLGFQRSELTAAERAEADEQIQQYLANNENQVLRWSGPRTVGELTLKQQNIVNERLQSETYAQVFDAKGYVLGPDGQPQIFPADVLVPAGRKYKVGDTVISSRVPGSAKNSVIAGEVVGLLPPQMGNIIVTGKEGPGVLGFDFDIDGLFTWIKDANPKSDQARMFDIAWGILLAPRNYAEVTTPVSTDLLKEQAAIFGARKGDRPKASRFSPFRQFELKNLNTVGKDMIGVTAKSYGVWSVLNQTQVELTPSVFEMVNFTFNDRAYNLDGEWVRGYPQTDSEGRPVFDNFQQLLNGATDNAKLQFLGKLGIGPYTSAVYMDMIAHGFSIEHTNYFINQEILRELIEETERQSSATFQGRRQDPYDVLMARWEQKAKEIDPQYQYNPIDPNTGLSTRKDVIFAYKLRPGFQAGPVQVPAEVMMSRQDRRQMSKGQLEALYTHGNKSAAKRQADPAMEKRYIDAQLAVLEKFKYYQSLAKATGGAGALISLASSFPSTYLEVWNAKKKIDEAVGVFNSDKMKYEGQKISIQGLTEGEDPLGVSLGHPYFAFQYETLGRILRFYEEHKLYAQPDFIQMHQEVVGRRGVADQETVMADFYTYVLIDDAVTSTANYNGRRLKPQDFVHVAAETIAGMKEGAWAEDEFLRHLQVKENPHYGEPGHPGEHKPALIQFQQLYDLGEEELRRVHAAFLALPGDVFASDTSSEEYQTTLLDYGGERVDVQRLLLANLAHTNGLKGGGFTYAKLLPASVKAQLDGAINRFENDYYAAKAELNNLDFHLEKLLSPSDRDTLSRMEVEVASTHIADETDMKMGGFTIGEEITITEPVTGMGLYHRRHKSEVIQALTEAGFELEKFEALAARERELRDKVGLYDFKRQVYLNHPQLAPELKAHEVRALIEAGLASYKGDSKRLTFKADLRNGLSNTVFRNVSEAGVATMWLTNANGLTEQVIFEVTSQEEGKLELYPTDFVRVKGVQQYVRGSHSLEPLPEMPARTSQEMDLVVDENGNSQFIPRSIEWSPEMAMPNFDAGWTPDYSSMPEAQEFIPGEDDALLDQFSAYDPSWLQEFETLPFRMSAEDFIAAKTRQNECN